MDTKILANEIESKSCNTSFSFEMKMVMVESLLTSQFPFTVDRGQVECAVFTILMKIFPPGKTNDWSSTETTIKCIFLISHFGERARSRRGRLIDEEY